MTPPKPSGPAHSLDELEPLSVAALAKRPPTREVAKARGVPIIRLRPDALLALLHDGRGLKHILPLAIKAAEAAPWADRGMHRGDLLMAVLHAPSTLRPPGSKLNRAIVALAKSALREAGKRTTPYREPQLEAEIAAWLQRREHWAKG